MIRLGVLDSKVSVLHFKSTKPGVGYAIVSFSRNENHEVGPLNGSLRNKGVLSLAKGLLLYGRPWREPRGLLWVICPVG